MDIIQEISNRCGKIEADLKTQIIINENIIKRLSQLENKQAKKPEPDIISTPIEQYERDHKTPRVGQLCYVWDDEEYRINEVVKFSRFNYGFFQDPDGYIWRFWSFIPREDIE